jgi:nicotinamidase-related amidase
MKKEISEYMGKKKIAVLVIDMQNDFLCNDAPIKCAGGMDVVPAIQKLLLMSRKKGVPIIYTQEAHRVEKVDFGLELQGDEPEHCLEGSKGHQIIPELSMQEGDYLIIKRRYSAFFATDLDILLRGLGVELLILTGVATDVCVRSTAQDAQQLNYRVVVPMECVAGTNEKRHEAALENIRYLFGKISSLDELLAILNNS